MKIFLIGFMGAGKSTFGKKLAAAMGYGFFDLDQEFEKRSGGSAADFISSNGESAFREMESVCLKSAHWAENSVIATGGGTPCFFDNLEWMKKNGLTIYLNVPEGVLMQRLSASPGQRPILGNREGEELKQHISRLLAGRKSYYEQADLTINREDLSVDKAKQMIGKWVTKRD
jgi:shikimate kinase